MLPKQTPLCSAPTPILTLVWSHILPSSLQNSLLLFFFFFFCWDSKISFESTNCLIYWGSYFFSFFPYWMIFPCQSSNAFFLHEDKQSVLLVTLQSKRSQANTQTPCIANSMERTSKPYAVSSLGMSMEVLIDGQQIILLRNEIWCSDIIVYPMLIYSFPIFVIPFYIYESPI